MICVPCVFFSERAALKQRVCSVVAKWVSEYWSSRVIVFLPGTFEIIACMFALSQMKPVQNWGEVHCFHAAQGRVLEEVVIVALEKIRKFIAVLGTDVASSSRSFRVDVVMCSGLEMRGLRNGSLFPGTVSVAVRAQRRGRAGRILDFDIRFDDFRVPKYGGGIARVHF